MKKIRIESAEDLASLPEREWFSVPGGTPVEHTFEGFRVEDGKLHIHVPKTILRQFKPGRGRRLRAKLRGTDLVVEK